MDTVDAIFFSQQLVELGDIGGQILDCDRCVLNNLSRLGVTWQVVDQPLARPPQLPDLVRVVAKECGEGIAEPGCLQVGGDSGQTRHDCAVVGMLELHH